jgi:DNA-binding CsgD family transcriptional regulator
MLRIKDVREIMRVVGECRELGDDKTIWKRHAIERFAALSNSAVGSCSEIAGFRSLRLRFLDPTDAGWATDSDRTHYYAGHAKLLEDPKALESLLTYHQWCVRDDGVCLSRSQLFTERRWLAMAEYQTCFRPIQLKNTLWCIRSLDGTNSDMSFGLSLFRPRESQTFGARDRAIVQLGMAALAPMIGGPLSGSIEPSPTDLAPQVRRVLRCLLEGDSDKQIALRMRLSRHTVNQYTKVIYRHFRVRGRSELMARWIRRGWGARFAWVD